MKEKGTNEAGEEIEREIEVDKYVTKQGFTKADIRQLAYQFTKQADKSAAKWDYAKALENLDDTEFINLANDAQIQVREFALKYLQKNPTRPQE